MLNDRARFVHIVGPATDTKTGQVVWKSPDFASYTCPHPIAANGRIFYCPQTSGIIFCFEPSGAE